MPNLLGALVRRGPGHDPKAPDAQKTIANLQRKLEERSREVRALEKVARSLLDERGALPLPPPELRVHVGRIDTAANFWGQGYDSSRRVLEVFGDDPGGPVLDWGCGSGRTLSWLRGVGTWDRWYQGCDVDGQAIEWLRQQGVGSVAVCGDEPPLPYAPESLAGLFCFSVLTHIPPARHAGWYAEMRRVLRPGARACITVNGDGHAQTAHFNEKERRKYAARGWAWFERDGHYKNVAIVTRPFTLAALGDGFEIEQYREGGYHGMDELIVRRR